MNSKKTPGKINFNLRDKKTVQKVIDEISKKISDTSRIDEIKKLVSSSPYASLSIWWSIIAATIGGLLIWFATFFFIQPSEVFVGGVTGVALIFTSINRGELEPYFYIFLAVIQIPFVILGFWKISVRFTFLTLYVIILQLIIGTVLSFLPRYTGNPDAVVNLTNSVFQITNSSGAVDEPLRIISAFFGSLIFAGGVGICFIGGLSSGGTDFLNTYMTLKSKKSIGYSIFIVNGVIIVASFIIVLPVQQAFQTAPNINSQEILNNRPIQYFFNLLIPTLLYLFSFSVILDLLFPINRKIVVNIITKRKEYIIPLIRATGFNRSFTSVQSKGSTTDSEIVSIVTRYREAKFLVKFISLIDDKAFITASDVRFIAGRFKKWKIR